MALGSSILGQALGAGAAIFGGVAASKAMEKAKAAVANTVQAGAVANDAVNRYVGEIKLNVENGSYTPSRDKSLAEAVWQAEGNAIVENFSQVIFKEYAILFISLMKPSQRIVKM